MFISYFYKRIQRTFNLIQVISTWEGGGLISNNILISIQITVTVFIQINSPIKTRNSPSRYLLVQSQQCKHQNNVWNLFKVYNKDTRTTSLALFIDVILMSLLLTLNDFIHCYGSSIDDFEQANTVGATQGSLKSARISLISCFINRIFWS